MYRKALPWYLEKAKITKKEIDDIKEDFNEFSILNWNVHKNNHSYKWLYDFRYILSKFKPDLIAFQEYKKINYKSIIDKDDKFNYLFMPNISLNKSQSGLISASKMRLLDCRSEFSRGVEPIFKTPKGFIYSRYSLNKVVSLSIINVHMINFVKFSKFKEQLDQIYSVIRDIKEPMVLIGDFNTWSKKRALFLNHIAKELGMLKVDFGKQFIELDHIFYRGLELKNSIILKDIKSSDHKPMVVRFMI